MCSKHFKQVIGQKEGIPGQNSRKTTKETKRSLTKKVGLLQTEQINWEQKQSDQWLYEKNILRVARF